ncbi:MAG: CVNH domain protein [Syntrophorhabdus sp. PtaB.Bin047]|jgi:hypothetical protein|nr:MAG: CVNH domain protein [Syntrophorhabdus sp. PtaB.Bin047]
MHRAQRKLFDPWKVWMALFCLLAASLLGAAYVSAGPPVPDGTYKRTCRNINYNTASDRLMASCKRINGSWATTQFSNCTQCRNNGGDIENCNGKIECTGVGIPNVGSYKRSCFCCRMEGSTLSCYCITRKNTSHWTSLPNAGSYRTIWNENGTLRGGH